MKISVVTVCFNSAKTIQKTLDTMLVQTYQDFEYIVVDGGSTDGTLDILESYKSKFGGRMSYISEPDQGIYDAMNKGIQMTCGDLIGLVNSDDWYEPNTLELAEKAYSGHLYEVVYGMQRSVKDGKEVEIRFNNHQFLPEQMISHPTCFVTAKTYEKFGMFNLKYQSSSDYEFMLRLYKSEQVVFTPVYSIMSNFSLSGMSSSLIGSLETLKIKKHEGYIGNKQYLFKLIVIKLKLLLHY